MRYFAIIYYSLQGVGTLLWWIVLFIYPNTRKFFMVATSPDIHLFSFLTADIIFFVIGSLAIAYGIICKKKWLCPLMLFVSGGIVYASLYCWHLTLTSNQAILAAVMMAPPLVISPYFTCHFYRKR